jgi:hypothetical protein
MRGAARIAGRDDTTESSFPSIRPAHVNPRGSV